MSTQSRTQLRMQFSTQLSTQTGMHTHLRRRTLTTAAAWALPTMALAAPAQATTCSSATISATPGAYGLLAAVMRNATIDRDTHTLFPGNASVNDAIQTWRIFPTTRERGAISYTNADAATYLLDAAAGSSSDWPQSLPCDRTRFASTSSRHFTKAGLIAPATGGYLAEVMPVISVDITLLSGMRISDFTEQPITDDSSTSNPATSQSFLTPRAAYVDTDGTLITNPTRAQQRALPAKAAWLDLRLDSNYVGLAKQAGSTQSYLRFARSGENVKTTPGGGSTMFGSLSQDEEGRPVFHWDIEVVNPVEYNGNPAEEVMFSTRLRRLPRNIGSGGKIVNAMWNGHYQMTVTSPWGTVTYTAPRP